MSSSEKITQSAKREQTARNGALLLRERISAKHILSNVILDVKKIIVLHELFFCRILSFDFYGKKY